MVHSVYSSLVACQDLMFLKTAKVEWSTDVFLMLNLRLLRLAWDIFIPEHALSPHSTSLYNITSHHMHCSHDLMVDNTGKGLCLISLCSGLDLARIQQVQTRKRLRPFYSHLLSLHCSGSYRRETWQKEHCFTSPHQGTVTLKVLGDWPQANPALMYLLPKQ